MRKWFVSQQNTESDSRGLLVIAFVLFLLSLVSLDSAEAAGSRQAQQRGAQRAAPQMRAPASRLPAKATKPQYNPGSEGAPSAATQTPRIDTWTRTVRAADASNSPIFAETLALAMDAQFLLVPLDFVSDMWLVRGNIRFFVADPVQEARLVDLDLVAGLALLRVEQPLIPSFMRSALRVDTPSAQETLLEIAGRDWVRSGAKLLRARSDGQNVRFQIGFGSSGSGAPRYVTDRAGRLVAVVSGQEKGETAWGGSARSVYELLRRQDTPKPASIAGLEQRRQQMFVWQDRWSKTFSPANKQLSLGALECRPHLVTVSDKNAAEQVKKVRALSCQDRMPVALGGGYKAGIQLIASEVTLRSVSNDMEHVSRIAELIGSETFNDHDKTTGNLNLMTTADCQDTQVVNGQGQAVRVRYCTSALKNEAGLNDTSVVLTSLEDGTRAFVAVARLKGFSQGNTRRILEALVENSRSFR